MERELRESNTNLTSYVSGLQTELDGWKSEGTRALSKLEEKQGADKEAFLQVCCSVYYSVCVRYWCKRTQQHAKK